MRLSLTQILESIVLELLQSKTSERQEERLMQTLAIRWKRKTRGLFLMKKSTAINQYLKEQASLDLLRFITCGSVDDGKSTLIGRML